MSDARMSRDEVLRAVRQVIMDRGWDAAATPKAVPGAWVPEGLTWDALRVETLDDPFRELGRFAAIVGLTPALQTWAKKQRHLLTAMIVHGSYPQWLTILRSQRSANVGPAKALHRLATAVGHALFAVRMPEMFGDIQNPRVH